MFGMMFKALVLSPGTIVGAVAGIAIPYAFKWKPSTAFWLLIFFLNIPTLIIFHHAFFENPAAPSSATIIASLLIYFWGTGGLGIALPVWLIFTRCIKQPDSDEMTAPRSAEASEQKISLEYVRNILRVFVEAVICWYLADFVFLLLWKWVFAPANFQAQQAIKLAALVATVAWTIWRFARRSLRQLS
jgi:hypothetical protein